MGGGGLGVVEMLKQVDWSEKWIWGLVSFHIACGLFTIISLMRKNNRIQIFLFSCFLGLVYFSENVNEFAANNYRYISKYQYFDDRGMFISIFLSTPLLIFSCILVIMWMVDTIFLLIHMKKKDLKNARIKKSN